jgi:hypothetical protein
MQRKERTWDGHVPQRYRFSMLEICFRSSIPEKWHIKMTVPAKYAYADLSGLCLAL